MKIAIYALSFENVRGGERVAINLANELYKYYDVFIINSYINSPSYSFTFKPEIFYLHELNGRLQYNFFQDIKRLHQYLNANTIDVMIIIGRFSVPVVPIWAALNTQTKVVFAEQSTVYKYLSSAHSIKDAFFRLINQLSINYLTNKIVTLTDKERKLYLGKFNLNDDKIITIPNFLVPDLVGKKFAYQIESRKIITVGRIEYDKGMDYLLRIGELVFSIHPDWQWDLFGTGDDDYIQSFRHQLKMKGLENNIIIRGVSNHIYEEYPKYDFEVLTSIREGFSMVLLEGKAFHLPEIAFDIYSGPSDLIINDVNGYLIKPFDVEEMASKICYLIEHPEVRLNFAKHAKDNISKFHVENVVDLWRDLLDGFK